MQSNFLPILRATAAGAAALLGATTLSAQQNEDPGAMSPARGYLEAHRDVQAPIKLLGGPILTSVSQEGGTAHAALPAPRELDEVVFGTPEHPLATGGFPMIEGLPLEMRAEKDGAFSATKEPTPFGDKHQSFKNARLQLDATDVTATDAASSEDRVQMIASWEDDEGNTYSVQCCEKLESVGGQHPTFGGVVTNHMLHGFTRVGTPLFPTLFAEVGFWGMGEIMKNGEVIDSPRPMHGMLTEYARTENYDLVFDENVDPSKRYFHIMVPPVVPADGGGLENKPVKTGFNLPEGKELPFWHVMFEDLEVSAERAGE